MEKLKAWQECLRAYNKLSDKFLKLTTRQEACLEKSDLDGFLSFFDKKQALMEEMDALKEQVMSYKEQVGEDVPEPYLSEIRDLQAYGQQNIQEAMKKVGEMEKILTDSKLQVGQELQALKRDKQASHTYTPSPAKKKDEGFFFDQKG